MSGDFRLGVVLRLRELAEEAARGDLSRTLRAHRESVADLDRALDAVRTERERAESVQAASRLGPGTPAGDLAEALASVEGAEAAVAAREAVVAAAADALLEARGRLAAARQRREVVERLRDRLAAARRSRVLRREDAALNEIASARHARAVLEEAGR